MNPASGEVSRARRDRNIARIVRAVATALPIPWVPPARMTDLEEVSV